MLVSTSSSTSTGARNGVADTTRSRTSPSVTAKRSGPSPVWVSPVRSSTTVTIVLSGSGAELLASDEVRGAYLEGAA